MTDTKTILTALEASVGKELFEKIRSSRLLVVGAGGIGCELLKNLAMAGFTCLEAIDLDTIDVSNLNRQLLFRSHHVGAPKCTTACAVAAQMALPETVSYRAKHGNVCDNDTCNVQFVQQFDVVLNALDNVAARRRVNRLCLAAGVPLLEAGTTGFLGQVQTIHAGSNTACYECATQETAKVYPICTIRSTPSAPVHTIVWAKELYKLLFATKVEESMLYEDPAGEEPSTYMAAVMEFRDLMMSRLEEQCVVSSVVDAVKTAAKKLVTTLYVDEIQKQLDLDRYKTAKKKPVTLDAAMIDAGMEQQAAPSSKSSYKHTDVWSREECVAEWVACLQDAANGAAAGESKVLPAFDKDDDLSMRFVTATSNLRSYLFGIEPIQSYYSAKGIAGNIIPAIATTNAIAAGLQILQVFQILRAQLEAAKKMPDHDGDSKSLHLDQYCSYINVVRNATRSGLLLTASKLAPPNPNCFVCKNAILTVKLSVDKWNLQEFLEKIVKKKLGFDAPMLILEGGDCIWEEGEDADTAAFEKNLTKPLPQLPRGGIQHGTMMTIEDFSQDLTVEVAIAHVNEWPKKEDDEEEQVEDEFRFEVEGVQQKPVAATNEDNTSPKTVINGSAINEGDKKPSAETEDDDDIVEVLPTANGNSTGAARMTPAKEDDDDDDDDVVEVLPMNGDSKRPAAEENGDAPPAKKARPSNDEPEVIEID